MKILLFVCVSASICFAATGDLRFRAEFLRGPAANLARQPVAAKEFGLVNRVRFRIAQGNPAAVEREPVVAPDAQKATQSRPTPVAGTPPWIRETITAVPAGAQIIGWAISTMMEATSYSSAGPQSSASELATGSGFA